MHQANVHQHFTCIKQMFISIPHASSNHVHQANVHQHPTCIESHHDAPCSPANSKITERCTHPCSPSNDEIAPRRTHIHFTQSKATPPARKLSQHSCHLHGNQKPSARTDAPPPATNPNRGNVKNHQMRQTSNHVEATSRIIRRDNLRRHGNLPYICASRTRTQSRRQLPDQHCRKSRPPKAISRNDAPPPATKSL